MKNQRRVGLGTDALLYYYCSPLINVCQLISCLSSEYRPIMSVLNLIANCCRFKLFNIAISIGNHTHSSPIWEIIVLAILIIVRGEAKYDFCELHVQLLPKLDENVYDCLLIV